MGIRLGGVGGSRLGICRGRQRRQILALVPGVAEPIASLRTWFCASRLLLRSAALGTCWYGPCLDRACCRGQLVIRTRLGCVEAMAPTAPARMQLGAEYKWALEIPDSREECVGGKAVADGFACIAACLLEGRAKPIVGQQKGRQSDSSEQPWIVCLMRGERAVDLSAYLHGVGRSVLLHLTQVPTGKQQKRW